MEIVRFKTEGYDPTIDYIKGLSILFVVLTHCINEQMHQYSLFCLWGDMAVPLFILIQIFHAYKKGIEQSTYSFVKMYKRVLRPFILIQVALFALMLAGGGKFTVLCYEFLESGGQGAGSYYVWIYVQFAIILPLIAPFVSKLSKNTILIGFIIISALIEVICCVVQIAPWLYRLLMLRYVFLIYCGIQLLREGIVMNTKTCVISFVSAVSILLFNYCDYDMQPIFFYSSWKVFHWPCYFFVSGMLLLVIVKSFDYTRIMSEKIHDLIINMGRNSYEIFLFQMIFFFILAYVKNRIGNLQETCFFDLAVLLFSPILCIAPVLLIKKFALKRS